MSGEPCVTWSRSRHGFCQGKRATIRTAKSNGIGSGLIELNEGLSPNAKVIPFASIRSERPVTSARTVVVDSADGIVRAKAPGITRIVEGGFLIYGLSCITSTTKGNRLTIVDFVPDRLPFRKSRIRGRCHGRRYQTHIINVDMVISRTRAIHEKLDGIACRHSWRELDRNGLNISVITDSALLINNGNAGSASWIQWIGVTMCETDVQRLRCTDIRSKQVKRQRVGCARFQIQAFLCKNIDPANVGASIN